MKDSRYAGACIHLNPTNSDTNTAVRWFQCKDTIKKVWRNEPDPWEMHPALHKFTVKQKADWVTL